MNVGVGYGSIVTGEPDTPSFLRHLQEAQGYHSSSKAYGAWISKYLGHPAWTFRNGVIE